MSYGSDRDCKIYVGNLPPDICERHIDDLFCKFGKIVDIDLKNRRGPPFAFVEFADSRDAADAIEKRDGHNYDGYKLRVEYPRGNHGRGDSMGRMGGGGRGGGGRFRDNMMGGGGGGGRGMGPSRRTEYRVYVKGLPPTGSWQDLKDHMREAGDVAFADVFKDGTGVVEYLRKDDMKYAVKKLDDSKFRSHEGETAYIRVIEDRGGSGSKRSRSRSRSWSAPRKARGSPSYSPMKRSFSRSRSRDRSRSPY